MTTPAQPPIDGSTRTANASEEVLASGLNSRAHEFSHEIRRRNATQTRQTAEARLDAADQRDVIADARDLAAPTRDEAADARGLRKAGAADREQAARERLHALVDREILADELAVAENDPLTGARTRAAGLVDLGHELDRCRRSRCELVVAYVDVVGLKSVNDTQGHEAGDELLATAVRIMKEHLRPYDLVIRLGGDEFLCAMSRMNVPDAQIRLAVIAGALSETRFTAAIRTGFAALAPGDGPTELIARADGAMLHGRRRGHGGRPAGPVVARMRSCERVAAQAASVAPVRHAVVAFAAGAGASELVLDDVAIAVSEALNNAVLHAYAAADSPGVVSVDAWVSGRSLTAVVYDEGGGMLPGARGPGLGLGLALIVRTTERVELQATAQGMRVRMTFALD